MTTICLSVLSVCLTVNSLDIVSCGKKIDPRKKKSIFIWIILFPLNVIVHNQDYWGEMIWHRFFFLISIYWFTPTRRGGNKSWTTLICYEFRNRKKERNVLTFSFLKDTIYDTVINYNKVIKLKPAFKKRRRKFPMFLLRNCNLCKQF